MSIIWLDGFESYGVDSGDVLETEMLRYGYDIVEAGSSSNPIFILTDGRNFGKALTCRNRYNIQKLLRISALKDGATDNVRTIGFAIRKSANYYQYAEMTLFSIRSETDGHQIGVYLSLSGSLDIKPSGSSSTVYASIPTLAGDWNYIEIKIVCDNSAGSLQVKHNGQEVFYETGLDTQSVYSSNKIGYITLYAIQGVSIDDLYVTTGEFLGPITLECLTPDADLGTTTWLASSGSDHYAMINGQPMSDDYIYASENSGTRDDYVSMSNLQNVNTDILGVYVAVAAQVTSPGVKYLETQVYNSTGDYLVTDEYISNSSYDTFKGFWTTGQVNDLSLRVGTT